MKTFIGFKYEIKIFTYSSVMLVVTTYEKATCSVWVPFIDRVPNDRPFHKCNTFGVDCYCTHVIVYGNMGKQTRTLPMGAQVDVLNANGRSLGDLFAIG